MSLTKPGVTFGEILAGHATRDPQAPAIVCTRLGRLSFGDLFGHIKRVGGQLRAAGIGSASRVGVALPRGPEAALLTVAVCCTATLVPLNPTLPPDELRAELKSLRLNALIVSGEPVPAWADAAGADCGLFAAPAAASAFAAIKLEQLRPCRNRRPASDATAESWAAILRTSGTTGQTKRVPMTHGNLAAAADKLQQWLALTPADRSASILPIYYCAGLQGTLLAPLAIGCSVALPTSTAPQDLERWVGDLRPTWLMSSPAFLQALVETLGGRAAKPAASGWAASLRFVVSTASYLPPATAAELERLLGLPVAEAYGLTEAGMMTGPSLPPQKAKPGSVGRIPEGELAIRKGGTLLPPGAIGHIAVRGPTVTPGYLLDDIDGVPGGLEDGWLVTGDLGTVDADGFLSIVGRQKEIINRGGEKISPYDVEKAMLGHPAVKQAAAFALPHPHLGEHVGAAVVLHAGRSLTSSELRDFIFDRLASFQMPRHIHIVDSLPVGPTGKILRSQLPHALAGHERSQEQPAAPLEIMIAEIWQRLLKRSDIGMDDDFFELGGDSLLATEMLLELEEIARHRIAPSRLRAELTIRHLVRVVAAEVAAKREVISLARPGHGTPLFLWHGDYEGWGLYGFRLAAQLKGDGPVYLLHSILGLDDGLETIEDMVRRQLPEIEAAAPTGPIRLAGFCHGGHAALEAASRLEAAGRTIETVALIDAYSINARRLARAPARLVALAGRMVPGRLGGRIRQLGPTALWVLVQILQGDQATWQRVLGKLRSHAVGTWTSSQPATYHRAMAQYLPPRIDAEVICLVCEESLPNKAFAIAPWRRVAANVRWARIPGDHHDCVSRYFRDLAASLDRMMPGDALRPLAGDPDAAAVSPPTTPRSSAAFP